MTGFNFRKLERSTREEINDPSLSPPIFNRSTQTPTLAPTSSNQFNYAAITPSALTSAHTASITVNALCLSSRPNTPGWTAERPRPPSSA